ncbi:unnamed protein product [Heterobilharzia americana]|nr:unnamed protein product [Heterobilharzia americana]
MLNEVEDEHHKEFREKRKQHYNEFLAVKLAKENLLSDDEDETTMVDEDKEEIDEEIRHNVEQAAINARLNAELSRISRRNNDQSVDDNTSRIHNSLLKHAKP